MESFHSDGSPTNVRQHHGSNHLVVRGEFALGNAVVGEQNFLGMCDQRASRTTSRTALSLRMPRNRGCRSLPNFVHSMKPACTTIVGRTQCARRRGNPTALVKGGC